jgi:hypothetical protein
VRNWNELHIHHRSGYLAPEDLRAKTSILPVSNEVAAHAVGEADAGVVTDVVEVETAAVGSADVADVVVAAVAVAVAVVVAVARNEAAPGGDEVAVVYAAAAGAGDKVDLEVSRGVGADAAGAYSKTWIDVVIGSLN